jgi:hypothetical protein
MGEGRRAGHMHPVPFACHIQPGFILMDDLGLFQRLCDLLLHRGQRKRAAFDQVTDHPFTHPDSQQVPHHLAGVGQWQQLLLDQIHRRRSNVGSILDGSLHPGWKCGYGEMVAVGTLFLLCPVFPTTTRGDGRSTTWRRSSPQAATACGSYWQASHRSTC